MTSVAFIAIGSILIYLVITDQLTLAGQQLGVAIKATPTGYSNLSWTPFLMGMVVLSVPVVALSSTGNRKAAWAYIALILTIFILSNENSVNQFLGEWSTVVGGSK